jgi:EAL domain-containing protein (putative c-di-GMP-specific phosphodiesterase class I)
MPLLTERVVSLALGQIRQWSDQGLHIPVAVNVSPTDLAGRRLTGLLASGLAAHGVPSDMIQLEITERVVAEETEDLNSVLLELHRMGVALSIDDFGTAYSSLRRLKTLPVSELKIDRTFVSNLCDSPVDIGIVRAVIDVAHALGMPAIAEGVETESEWDMLRSLGCDGAQGWYIARPMAAPQATEWIRSRSQDVLRLPTALVDASNQVA